VGCSSWVAFGSPKKQREDNDRGVPCGQRCHTLFISSRRDDIFDTTKALNADRREHT
jgi:hypothetical protein